MLPQVATIQKYKQVEGGAIFQVFVSDYNPAQKLSAKCEIRFDDGRKISAAQRGLIFALCKDISNWCGYDVEDLRRNILLINFLMEKDLEWFSLSDVDMTTARLYIEYILDFCFTHDVHLTVELSNLAKEVSSYLYLCILHRKCACCGEHAEIHHVDAIGMGRDRHKIDHTQHRLVALCTKHHQMAHSMGWESFKTRYHLDGIKVNAETIKKIGL